MVMKLTFLMGALGSPPCDSVRVVGDGVINRALWGSPGLGVSRGSTPKLGVSGLSAGGAPRRLRPARGRVRKGAVGGAKFARSGVPKRPPPPPPPPGPSRERSGLFSGVC